MALAILAGAAALTGCGSDDDEPRVQRVAFCPGPSSDPDNMFDVEFRQGSTVVATGSASAGGAVTAEVPLGAVDIYADGVWAGSANEGVEPDATDGGLVYVSGPGCPDAADL